MQRRDFIRSGLAAGLFVSSGLSLADSPATSYSLQGTDVYGKKLDLRDFSGLTVLVSFFTFDCEVCSDDLKLMREFYFSNKKKKFMLLGVNLDTNKKDLDDYNELTTQAYSKDQRFPTVWRNAAGHTDNFGSIRVRPTHFVLDGNAKLKFRREGKFQPDDWDNLWLTL